MQTFNIPPIETHCPRCGHAQRVKVRDANVLLTECGACDESLAVWPHVREEANSFTVSLGVGTVPKVEAL